MEHCLGADRKCTCPCGKSLRPEFSVLREQRGRICADCQYADDQAKAQVRYDWEQENCICSWNEFSGRSICGVPCPVHCKDQAESNMTTVKDTTRAYENGVRHERAAIVKELLNVAIERKALGYEQEVLLLTTLALRLENGLHLTSDSGKKL